MVWLLLYNGSTKSKEDASDIPCFYLKMAMLGIAAYLLSASSTLPGNGQNKVISGLDNGVLSFFVSTASQLLVIDGHDDITRLQSGLFTQRPQIDLKPRANDILSYFFRFF